MRPATAREPGELVGPRFALLADVFVLGLATTVAALPLITAPATAAHYAAALRARLRPGDLLAGAAALGGVALLLLNAITGAGLPGAAVIRPALVLAGAFASVVLLRACARPESLTNWRRVLPAAAEDTLRRAGGSAVLLLALATAAACAWAFPPLALLAAGPLALAARAVAQP